MCDRRSCIAGCSIYFRILYKFSRGARPFPCPLLRWWSCPSRSSRSARGSTARAACSSALSRRCVRALPGCGYRRDPLWCGERRTWSAAKVHARRLCIAMTPRSLVRTSFSISEVAGMLYFFLNPLNIIGRDLAYESGRN